MRNHRDALLYFLSLSACILLVLSYLSLKKSHVVEKELSKNLKTSQDAAKSLEKKLEELKLAFDDLKLQVKVSKNSDDLILGLTKDILDSTASASEKP